MGFNKKGLYLAFGSMSFLIVSGAGVSAIDSYQEQVKLKQEKVELENKKTAIEQAKREALIAKYTGVNPDYIEHAYDSTLVYNKLLNKDYSNNEKIVFLTFDDSLSSNTSKILDILDANEVKATFFILGKRIESGGDTANALLKDIYQSGHAIGNHTYSQSSNILYPKSKVNVDNFAEELSKTEKLMQEALEMPNFKTRIYRAPGGTTVWRGAQSLRDYSLANNIIPIDWNISNKDSEGKKKSVEELVKASTENAKDKDMVVLLMHDNDSRDNTVESLDEIIKWYKDNGYTFKTLG